MVGTGREGADHVDAADRHQFAHLLYSYGRRRVLFPAVGIGGGTLGLLLGGVVTEVGSWRLTLFINVPIGIAGLTLAPRFSPKPRPAPSGSRPASPSWPSWPSPNAGSPTRCCCHPCCATNAASALSP
ncbi:hypothetical protein AB0L49_47795 [Streptomyces antimycoticus]|uniref:hypothetical protein n=1 Tax=Streptomyces antimycoticus TaxID=68175 RepID=UPI003449230D